MLISLNIYIEKGPRGYHAFGSVPGQRKYVFCIQFPYHFGYPVCIYNSHCSRIVSLYLEYISRCAHFYLIRQKHHIPSYTHDVIVTAFVSCAACINMPIFFSKLTWYICMKNKLPCSFCFQSCDVHKNKFYQIVFSWDQPVWIAFEIPPTKSSSDCWWANID